jgi:hypothetical protein
MNTEPLPNGVFANRHSNKDKSSYSLTEEAFRTSTIPLLDKLESFSRFATKRSIATFLVKQRIFEQILNINGVIVECGVFNGAGLFTWSQLSNIFEPTNYTRKIIGFDTFDGFPSIDSRDNIGVLQSKIGDLRGSTLEEFNLSIQKYNEERHLSHIPNIELIKGDFNVTVDAYLDKNKQTIVSLLYLDFDLYEPTKKALSVFVPRMPKGSIIAFDELNCNSFPGETLAFDEVLGIRNYELKRFPFDPWVSYIVL